MKRWWMLVVSAGVVCAVLGCVPRRLFWSPNGQHGAVIGEDGGLYLCSPAGKLSKQIAPDVGLVAWFPDSKRFIAVCSEEVSKWSAVEPVFSKARREAVIEQAGSLRAELLAYQGDWKQFEPKAGRELTPGEFPAMFIYLRDHDDGTLAKKLGDEWKELQKLNGKISRLQVFGVGDTGAVAGKVLHTSLDGPNDIRVSPDGNWAALTRQMSVALGLGRLEVIPTGQEAPPIVVAEQVSDYPDWSADGTYLYYGMTQYPAYRATSSLYPSGSGTQGRANDGDGDFTLGTLSRRKVIGADGGTLASLPRQEDLVGLMFWNQMKVRCLRDGRILFSSCDVKLPATTAEMPKNPNLFFIDPARQAMVTRVLPAEPAGPVEGLGTGQFELSPDQQRVAVVGGGEKQVSIVTLATGKVETILPAENAEGLPSLPAWRAAEELALIVPPKNAWGSPEREELVLYSLDGKQRCISRDWPAAVLTKPAEPQPGGGEGK
jgi:hypothetical protein